MALVVKKLPANAGDLRDMGSIPGLGRFPGKRHGNPLQYSYLENLVDRGAWWVTQSKLIIKNDIHGKIEGKATLTYFSSLYHSEEGALYFPGVH